MPGAGPGAPAGQRGRGGRDAPNLLLDDEKTTARWLQIGAPMLGALVLVGGLQVAYRLHGSGRWWGSAVATAGGLVLAAALRFSLKWAVTYKGHRIAFHNHPVWGERLYIDNVLVDRGRPGVHIRLRGTIESGHGSGERITSESRAALLSFSCRIVAETFLPGPP